MYLYNAFSDMPLQGLGWGRQPSWESSMTATMKNRMAQDENAVHPPLSF
jgi:hypothetical protein